MYEIILTDEANKVLRKLDVDARRRIVAILERIRIRPHNFVRRLYNSKYYRLRVDDYRVILDVKDVQLIIYVIEIGFRGNIYKRSF